MGDVLSLGKQTEGVNASEPQTCPDCDRYVGRHDQDASTPAAVSLLSPPLRPQETHPRRRGEVAAAREGSPGGLWDLRDARGPQGINRSNSALLQNKRGRTGNDVFPPTKG